MATPTPAADAGGFRVVAHGGGANAGDASQAFCLYITNNTEAEVETAGYFNPVRDFLKIGDIIMVSYDADGTPGSSAYVVATVPSGGDVTVTG